MIYYSSVSALYSIYVEDVGVRKGYPGFYLIQVYFEGESPKKLETSPKNFCNVGNYNLNVEAKM